jgi:hypothetical protein
MRSSREKIPRKKAVDKKNRPIRDLVVIEKRDRRGAKIYKMQTLPSNSTTSQSPSSAHGSMSESSSKRPRFMPPEPGDIGTSLGPSESPRSKQRKRMTKVRICHWKVI